MTLVSKIRDVFDISETTGNEAVFVRNRKGRSVKFTLSVFSECQPSPFGFGFGSSSGFKMVSKRKNYHKWRWAN